MQNRLPSSIHWFVRIFFPYVWHYLSDDYKDRLHHLVVDTILSFAVLLLIGSNVVLGSWLYLFSITPQVTAELTVPELVISGETLTVSAKLQAVNKTVEHVDVKLVLPQTFVTSDAKSAQWSRLATGKTDTITVTGRFDGEVKQTYRAIAVYTYDYYGQHFSDYATVEFEVDTSSLEITATTPEQILNNETFSWTVDYFNSSDTDRNDVCITLDYPEAFNLQTSSLPITDKQIKLATVAARSGGTVTITGSFSNAIGEGNHIIGIVGTDACAQQALQQIYLQQPVEVLTPRLQLTTSGTSVANIGEAVTYSVQYYNAGDTPLDTIATTVTKSDGTSLYWTDGTLLPGQRRTKTFTLTVPASTRQKNLSTSYTVNATANISDIGVRTYATAVNHATRYNSTLTLEQVARYTSTTGEQLGYGPYPLRAWEVTALRVFWQVEDFTNDLSDVTLTAVLPSQVEWTGHTAVTEGSAMTYDVNTHTVTWHSSSIPSFSHAQGANFEVRLMPNSDQVGKQINITNELHMTAHDSFTGTLLSQALGALRTTDPIEAER